MKLNREVSVIGVAMAVPVIGEDRSLEEVLYDVVQSALKDAGISIEDIDGIVVASNDQFDGRAISVMAASGSVGGVDRDILSTPSASEHAFVMGALRIASGQYETQLVVSWSPTEASSLSEAQRLGADPYFHRRLPLDEAAGAALQASAMIGRRSGLEELAERIFARNRANGRAAYPDAGIEEHSLEAVRASRPTRWPLREGMVAAPVTGAVALVLASQDFRRERGITNAARLTGMGWATEAGFLGDRDLSTATALKTAAKIAYGAAGIEDPRRAFDLAEITDTSPYQEMLAYDGLGLSDEAHVADDLSCGRFDPDGAVPVNLSGGVSSLNPVFCTGLLRIAEAANQVRGRAGAHQAARADTALAHAASGFAMMYQTVVVLERMEGEAA